MKFVITGAGGLIGSEAVSYFCNQGHTVIGFDNDGRKEYFGQEASVLSNIERLSKKHKNYHHMFVDVSSRGDVMWEMETIQPDIVIHCAAQPSHDRASTMVFADFDVNAAGTLNMLEATRRYSENPTFIHMSTNKVYGDNPNVGTPINSGWAELETRYVPDDPEGMYWNSVSEFLSVDHCMHSLFGASKLAGDIYAQEYGHYYGMNVGIFRGGCLTGPAHKSVQLHGFLSYLVKCAVDGSEYTVFGYKGKQVRDQIHSYDVVRAFDEFIKNPKKGEIYNIGGGHKNNASIIEIINLLEQRHNLKLNWKYVDQPRKGDHIWYVSDIGKFKRDYPNWDITKSLDEIVDELVMSFKK